VIAWRVFRTRLSQLNDELAAPLAEGFRIHSVTPLPLPAWPGRDVELLVILQR
jgi:hypothetical protein